MSDTVEFTPWPKIGRLNKPVVLTEKIDGTNAAVGIRPVAYVHQVQPFETLVADELGGYALRAQSRKRLITPQADNFGFASWAFDNAEILVGFLGEGLHFGEWWGQGIQRTYGCDRKHWSLFNTAKWGEPILYADAVVHDIGVDVVPVLTIWDGSDIAAGLRAALELLEINGSLAAIRAEERPHETPEGVMTFWTASNVMHKYIIDNPDTPKSAMEAQ